MQIHIPKYEWISAKQLALSENIYHEKLVKHTDILISTNRIKYINIINISAVGLLFLKIVIIIILTTITIIIIWKLTLSTSTGIQEIFVILTVVKKDKIRPSVVMVRLSESITGDRQMDRRTQCAT